jgi:hypothetical protein
MESMYLNTCVIQFMCVSLITVEVHKSLDGKIIKCNPPCIQAFCENSFQSEVSSRI